MHVQTYTIDQLAVLFQRSSATMRSYIDTLQEKHGFPAKLPCFDNLWSRPAVDRWIEGNGQAATPQLPVDPWQAEIRSALTAKYGAA